MTDADFGFGNLDAEGEPVDPEIEELFGETDDAESEDPATSTPYFNPDSLGIEDEDLDRTLGNPETLYRKTRHAEEDND